MIFFDHEDKWEMVESSTNVMDIYMNELGITNVESNFLYCFDKELVAKSTFSFLLCVPMKLCESSYTESLIQSSTKPMHIQQCISQACGFVGFLHCFINNDKVECSLVPYEI